MNRQIDNKKAYNEIAHIWDSDDFLAKENGIEQHKRAIQFTKKRGLALDIGCGASGRIIKLLRENGFEVEGLDFSEEMLRRARLRDSEIVYHQADIRTWNFTSKYDFVSGWDSIWHVRLSEQKDLIKKICEGLNKDGVFIFTGGGLDSPEEISNNAMGPELSYSTLGITGYLDLISKCGCVCRHFEFDQYPENHVCFIVQKIKGD
ncbi:MAG: class I SAM-dependent methyltransferase [Candidatus Delongbacteria bacterium]|nr:class I SAM-dependent methyltransferase [Candidatus Delongbacteria bacterium]MBN2835085.1 class I SAM-dependent methyltransferase [Candidatus Delongbacteria bacterium]